MDTQCNLCKKSDIVSEFTGILGYIYKAVEYGHQSYGVLYCYLLLIFFFFFYNNFKTYFKFLFFLNQ